jgi:Tol biopolymer transport system component
MNHRFVAMLAVLIIVWTPSSAPAQYFGANKVQHKTFDFQVLRTEHFDVYFYAEEREAAMQAGRMAERWHARLSHVLGEKLSTIQPLVLYASHADFEQTNTIEGAIGEGTGGVTEMLKRRIVLPLAPTLAETDHVIGHELVHAFQYDKANQMSRGENGGSRGIEQLPLWFIEGMAEYLSLGPVDPHTAMWIRDTAREGKLPTIRQMASSKYFPYRWGQAFWAYAAGRWGDRIVGQLLDAAIRHADPEAALTQVLNIDANELSKEWRTSIHDAYDPIATQTHAADDYGRALTEVKGPVADLNVSPSLSPDGTRVLYFSGRNLISVDMLLADVASGRVTESVVKTALDPHFSSLQFISSAGTWRADGRQVMFGAVSNGYPELAIYDIERARVIREIPFPTLGEVVSPSWAPDGRRVVFSATDGGLSDLFIYDLEAGSLRRATHDPFADIQPAWSPDGRTIAFVTERFGGDLSVLRPGSYRLALLDVISGRVSEIETFPDGKNINPAWSPDSGFIYFLSDQNGVTNAYAVNLATRQVRALTNLYGGISGITALSPALSSALVTPRLAFSAYEDGKYHIYIVDAPDALRDTAVNVLESHVSPAALPPQEREADELSPLLADATIGLPEAEGDIDKYRPRLSLDALGQASIGVGVDRFGTFVGGGVAFRWSDMLANHNLLAAIQTDTSFGRVSDIAKNTAGLIGYTNLTHRWNWGAAAQQVPYLSGGISSGLEFSGGSLVAVDERITLRQTTRGLNGIAAYPFNRARRVEFSGGYERVSFEVETNTTLTSLTTGEVLSDRTTTTALAEPLNLGTAAAATVFDTSVFGATSPVAGKRYRLEVTPTVGTIFFTGALADYRRYFAPVPFYTIATRVLHYGRYGGGADDYRLPPVFIGYPQLVRGYDIGSFDAVECQSAQTGSCAVFDRLLGSRMFVANTELRFPLLRPFGMRQNVYGPVPIEVAVFGDGGVAWTATEKPAMFGGTRKPVASTGVTLRVNLFNFAVGQLDVARPLQRRRQGWMFEFSLTPGF